MYFGHKKCGKTNAATCQLCCCTMCFVLSMRFYMFNHFDAFSDICNSNISSLHFFTSLYFPCYSPKCYPPQKKKVLFPPSLPRNHPLFFLVLAQLFRAKGDIVYTEDDLMSPADYAAGFRKWAPPAPGAEPGSYMAQAGGGRFWRFGMVFGWLLEGVWRLLEWLFKVF